MAQAIIMAGGRSQRMRASGEPRHKALLPVNGVSLFERNVRRLVECGFRDLAVALSAAEPELAAYCDRVVEPFVRANGGTLTTVLEHSPLGTIGAVREVELVSDGLLVVNVDNLTSLDLRAFVKQHALRRAAMTIATHRQTFRIPFGELRIADGDVREYREKPAIEVQVSSGTYVLSPAAIALIAPGESIGVPELFERVKARGMRVAPFEHDERWIDVNDTVALADAARLFPEPAE
jgi:NDP-sugar pyrophosphorylase family protein